ncbi:chromate resistance protein ChrB domain-containing protein [Raoultella terrigena]|uniref:chromate resistance protein ChrB domain-containing protein n=1 Tax=Raoultella terrigena TaxID=577 RepID=UPI00384D73F2
MLRITPDYSQKYEKHAQLSRKKLHRLNSSTAALETLSVSEFNNRIWATCRRPWVDRLASAWLILRFIDTEARFIWLDDIASCPTGAVGLTAC